MELNTHRSQLATRFSNKYKREHYSSHAITENELARLAPSVFAEGAHESRSARYSHIPTIEVLRGLRSHGFEPFFACEALARKEDKRGFVKHMLRLRHADQISKGGDVNEVIIINSHDGASAYQMLAGVFRFVCSNGMICGSIAEDLRVKHSGSVQATVIEGAFQVMRQFAAVEASKDAMKSIRLTPDDKRIFANAAHMVRYPVIDTEGESVAKPAPIDAEALLTPRRIQDSEPTLWNTFNTIQENAVVGGLRTNDRRSRRHTRGVNGIDGNVSLNRALWTLAEAMRSHKQS